MQNINDKITALRDLFSQRDAIDAQIAAMLGDAEVNLARKKLPKAVKTSSLSKRGPYKKTQREQADEADQIHGRSRLDPAVKAEIEQRLRDGETVASILEKVDVSAPTIYLIRSRLNATL